MISKSIDKTRNWNKVAIAALDRFFPSDLNLTSIVNDKDVKGNDSVEKIDLLNPATNTCIRKMQYATNDEIIEACKVAKKAQIEWEKLEMMDRMMAMQSLTQQFIENYQDICAIESLNTGRTITETIEYDGLSIIDTLNYCSGLSTTAFDGQFVPNMDRESSSYAYTKRVPVGVGLGINPFNYPLEAAIAKVGSAIACGNAIILKPSELTPLTTLAFGKLVSENDLIPKGLIQVILGAGKETEFLLQQSEIDKVSFTGSKATGEKIHKNSKFNQDITLELGGKSPLIILNDADLDVAVEQAIGANFVANGEVCSNGTRVFVQSEIYDEFVQKFKQEMINYVKIGDPLDVNTTVGPMISKVQLDKVKNYIDIGINQDKLKLLYNNDDNLVLEDKFKNGNFINPYIFQDCDNNDTLMQEEIFGMVACVAKFNTIEEVIKLANDGTEYGLASGVVSTNLNNANNVANQLDSGVVYVNGYNLCPPQVPWQGHKQSGKGQERGLAGMRNWTKEKTFHVTLTN